MKEFTNLIEVMMYFNDKNTCKEYLTEQRWGDGVVCPCCNNKEKIYKIKYGYKCSKCKKHFSVLKGTIFENSQIPLQKWFASIWLLTSHKKGISSSQLSKDIGVTQKTAWFILQRIRHAFECETFEKPLSNIVEVDETYVGGKNKNRHPDKKVKHSQGRSLKDKVPVFGLLERGGRVVAMKVAKVGAKDLVPLIDKHVDPSTHIMSDEWTAYTGLSDSYEHSVVNHGAKSYVVGNSHTNTIEGFWSILKRGIFGIYHSVSTKHIDRFVKEFEFRYNNRDISDQSRFNKMLKLCENRITYTELINKAS